MDKETKQTELLNTFTERKGLAAPDPIKELMAKELADIYIRLEALEAKDK